MKAFWSVWSTHCRMLLQYRAAALAGIATQVFWGLLRIMILSAFYRSVSTPMPMTLAQVVSYVWLSQALLRLIPWHVDQDIAGMIREGTVAYELVRPLDLYGFWFARISASLAAPSLLRSLPLSAAAMLFLGLQPPASLRSGLFFLLSLILALLLSSALVTLMSASLFWTLSGEGMSHLVPPLGWLLSGMVIPLPLFPEWAQRLVAVLPFRGMMDTPFRLYLGLVPTGQVLQELGHQLLWTTILVLLGRWALSRGVKLLKVQGG